MEKERFTDGNHVYCDYCNADGDETDWEGKPLQMGGALIGSSAVCNLCAVGHQGVVDKVFDASKTFGDNVRAYRMSVWGTDECFVEFTSW